MYISMPSTCANAMNSKPIPSIVNVAIFVLAGHVFPLISVCVMVSAIWSHIAFLTLKYAVSKPVTL